MAENQATVIALTQRLAQNDAELERLQEELQQKEEYVTQTAAEIEELKDSLLKKIDNVKQTATKEVKRLEEECETKTKLIGEVSF